MPRKLLFSVSIKDCVVETYTVPGPGGSGKDTSQTGVRVRHLPSGAVGKSGTSRSQLDNKRAAFRAMAESSIFKAWAHLQAASIRSGKSVEEIVETWMEAKHLKVEARTPLGWEVWEDDGKPEIDPALCRRCQRGPFVTSYHGVAITNAERLCYNCLDWDYHQDYMRSPG